jgi:hypothetical protein
MNPALPERASEMVFGGSPLFIDVSTVLSAGSAITEAE